MALEPDLREAARFLRLLDPGAEAFTFQSIPEAPDARGSATLAHGALEHVGDRLVRLNRRGHGVFVSTQRMDGGGRKVANFTGLRCCWLDIDKRAGQRLPKKWPLPPQIIVESSAGSFHCWWLLETEPRPSRKVWSGVQRQLVTTFRTDPVGHSDLTKVLRLPGFAHQKAEPRTVQIVESVRIRRSLATVAKVYTPLQEPPTSAKAKHTKADRPATMVDLIAVTSALNFLATIPHPHIPRMLPKYGGGRSTSFADDYGTWWRFGLALYRAFADDGFEAWHEWSQTSAAYPGAEACERKWRTFEDAGDEGVTLGSIFHAAKQHGWRRPYVPFRIAYEAMPKRA